MIDVTAHIPDRMVRNISLYFGSDGEKWLGNLPGLLSRTERQWSIRICEPFDNLSINFVAPVELEDVSEAVIKVGVPCREILTEIEALDCFGGRGAVRVRRSDAEEGLILLERVSPGMSLADELEEVQPEEIAAAVMSRLWTSPEEGHSFPHLRDWFSGLEDVRRKYEGTSGPLPRKLFETAEQLAAELLASTDDEVLLHGDCHHENILKSKNGEWLAIDPKGVIGDRIFEVCPFLRNPQARVYEDRFLKSIEIRSARFSELLSIDPVRLHSWGLAEAVLSASWDLGSKDESWKRTIDIALKYADMLGIDV